MYQRFFKEEFMETLGEKEKMMGVSIFNKSEKLEEMLGKDAYNFTTEEIGTLLYSLNSPHISTINSYMSILRKYSDYAISRGRTVSNINLYRTIRYSQFENYLAKHKIKHLSKTEFLDLINDVYNHQDYGVYMALFEGICGKHFSEFIKMEVGDLQKAKQTNSGYIITLHGVSEDRELEIENDTYKALINAYRQEEYYPKNGESTGRVQSRAIVEGNHVFRNVAITDSIEEKIDFQYIHRKIRVLAEVTNKQLTSKATIQNSGIIYYLYKLSKDNKVGREEMFEVIKRFEISVNKMSPIRTLESFVDKHGKALKEIYGVDMVL